MPAAEEKANFGYEHAVYQLQKIEDIINIIRTNARWQLGFLAAFSLGLASFVFSDLGELPIIHQDLDNATLFIKFFAGALLILYSGLMIYYIPRLLRWAGKVDNKKQNFNAMSKAEETEIIKAKIKDYAEKLYIMDKEFKNLMGFSIISPLLAAVFATCFTYLV